MDLYAFCLCLGGAGLAAMAAGGLFAQHHGRDHTDDVTLLAHLAGRAGRGAARAGGRGGVVKAAGGGRASWVLAILSPRVLFSVLVGFGATGMVARAWLTPWPALAAAALGGVAFERGVVAPLWNFLLKFASRPALTLESAVMDRAQAVTGFDAAGCGLVAIELDGHIVQVLATLTAAERAAGVRVRAGDRVRIEEVDAARNRCTVSHRGA